MGKDSLAGAMFLLFGAAGLYFGLDYPIGTSAEMGPGYLPIALSIGLLVIGALLVVQSTLHPASSDDQRVALPDYRPAIAVIGATVAFALIGRLGLAITASGVVLIATLAQPGWRLRRDVILAIVLALFAIVVFRGVLKMPIPLWPNF